MSEDVERREDIATSAPLCGLAALLDHAQPPWRSGEVPPLGHWLYFLPDAAQHEIAEDGHPRRRDALAAEFPRRMWAGGRVAFHGSIMLGSALLRETRTLASRRKTGKSGEMIFVTLEHRIIADGVLAVVEEQDLVYRAAAAPAANPAAAASPEPAFAAGTTPLRAVNPDEAMLFRFSALTFNAHRIHYDLPYAREREGYPALVVHGPLLATLLMDAWLRDHPDARPARFTFRAERPAFCGQTVSLHREGPALVAAASGQVAMRAEITV